jgi:predicted dehydrogenase
MKPIKIAMLSLTHGHTSFYYRTFNGHPKLEWVAVSAETETIKNNFLKLGFDIPCYLNEKEMFDKHPDIEAVVMASANNKHLQQFRECARRGIHILSMKVPSFDMDEYTEMIDLVEKAGIVCQVELEMHYNPVVARMKEVIASKELGKISAINATNITLSPVWICPWQGVPEESYGKRVQLSPGDSRFRGGALCDHPHVFDLIRWMTGSDFEYVYAEVGPNIRHDIVVEDTILINGKMKNGVNFLFDPSWSRLEERWKVPAPGWTISPKCIEVNITISGEKGVMLVDCFGPNVYHNGMPNDRYAVQLFYPLDEWERLMDEFADCIRNRKTPKINLGWHRKTIEAINGCYESVTTGKIVYL